MFFWIIAVAAAILTALAIAWPLIRRTEQAAPRAAHDAQVFRDQLKELDREVERGAVSPEDADSTRLELSRRLLAADEEMRVAGGAGPAPAIASRALAAILIVAAPAATLYLYADIGAPGAEDQPLASRTGAGRPSQAEAERMMAGRQTPPPAGEDVAEFEDLVRRLEARLDQAPRDAEGVFLYARSLMNLGRFDEAWPQFERLHELRPPTAETFAGLSEAQILAAGGYISPEAEANLLQVLKFQPTNPSARYYLGRLHIQDGAQDTARQIWEELLRESPPDAPWVPPIRAELAAIGAIPQVRGPTQDEMAAAGNIPPAERQAMVRQMVEGLAERLETEGGTVDEWRQLIRSYSVLGQQSKAQATLQAAREAMAGNPEALARLEAPDQALPGPTSEDMAAAAEMPAGDRRAMIEGMVGRLAERLATEGGTLDEWLRLISSYGVMGNSEAAAAAYGDARDAFSDQPGALATLEAAFEGAPRGDDGLALPPTAALAPERGPTQEDIAAAEDMAPEDRQEMIRGMVSRLHDRVREDGRAGDVNEWGKLMRSYRVLGDIDAIRAVYEEAIVIYDDDSISLAYLKEAALLNGVTFE